MTAVIGDGVVFTVEIGFSTTSGSNQVPLGGALTDIVWTDVTSYVRDVSTTRGRNSELDEFSTGSAQVTLSNRDRRFDSEYAAGPYFGRLTPGRPIRIRAQYGAGSTTNLFFGFVDSWDQQYVYPADAVAVVSASDAFKVFNLLNLPSYWDYQIGEDAPFNWFKLSEGAGVSLALDTQRAVTGLSWVTTAGVSSLSESASSLLVNVPDTAAKFDGTRGLVFYPRLTKADTIPATYRRTLELWISTETTADGTYGIAKVDTGEIVIGVGMVVSGGVGTIKIWRGTISGINLVGIFTSTVAVNDGEPHHITVPLYGAFEAPAVLPKVDDVNTSSVSGATWVDDYSGPDTFGLPMNQLSSDNFASPFVGIIDEIVLHKKTLTAAENTAHYQTGLGTFAAGETTSARITKLLTMARWMSDGSSLTTGNSTVQGIDSTNKTLLAALKECEAAEQGRLFIDRDGKARFISRQSINTVSTYNTSQRIYGDSGSELPYTDLQFEYNDRLITNRVTVSRVNGGSFSSDDVVSQGQYFIRASNVSNLITNNDRFSQDLSVAQVSTYKDPSLRINSMKVNARGLPASLYPAVIGDEIGTRVTVKRRPQNVGTVISKELLLEGISHNITPDSWETVYSFSPVPVDYFVLDSATFGVLDVNLLGY
jgi:hypothetical protein